MLMSLGSGNFRLRESLFPLERKAGEDAGDGVVADMDVVAEACGEADLTDATCGEG